MTADGDQKRVQMFTDGSCLGNPGPGGWAAILVWNGNEKELSGGEAETTNNRMELRAAIEGLAALKRDMPVDLYTDSTYVRNGITGWINNWKRNGWRTSQRKPVKNRDLWQRLDELVQQHQIEWHWVRGHSGHPENEQVDEAANVAIDRMLSGGES